MLKCVYLKIYVLERYERKDKKIYIGELSETRQSAFVLGLCPAHTLSRLSDAHTCLCVRKAGKVLVCNRRRNRSNNKIC